MKFARLRHPSGKSRDAFAQTLPPSLGRVLWADERIFAAGYFLEGDDPAEWKWKLSEAEKNKRTELAAIERSGGQSSVTGWETFIAATNWRFILGNNFEGVVASHSYSKALPKLVVEKERLLFRFRYPGFEEGAIGSIATFVVDDPFWEAITANYENGLPSTSEETQFTYGEEGVNYFATCSRCKFQVPLQEKNSLGDFECCPLCHRLRITTSLS